MAFFDKNLLNSYKNWYNENMPAKKPRFTKPKIYTGKNHDLKVSWYVYFNYQHPTEKTKSGAPKMVRFKAPTYNANREYKTVKERLSFFKYLQKKIHQKLKDGYIPEKGKMFVETNETNVSIIDGLQFALKQIQPNITVSTYRDYVYRVNVFRKFLEKNHLQYQTLHELNRKLLMQFLSYVAKKNSIRSRNNAHATLSSLFSVLVQNDLMQSNLLIGVKKVKTNPKVNKAFTKKEVVALFEYMKKNDIWLYYYCAHVYYGLFRPIEVCRIQIKNIDTGNQLIHVKTKTGNSYKQIPDILFKEFYNTLDLTKHNKNAYLFTHEKQPSLSQTKDTDRRTWYGKQFKKVKDNFGFDSLYTVYSFRHAAIGKMFEYKVKELQENKTPNYVEQSLTFIRSITLHKSNEIVKSYLRSIGYFKVSDWSELLE